VIGVSDEEVRSPATVSVRALRHLQDHPGEVMFYADVATAVEADAGVVGQALARMARENPGRGIVREGNNRSGKYVYRPGTAYVRRAGPVDGPKPGDLFECVGVSKRGAAVVRDPVTFVLYRLERT